MDLELVARIDLGLSKWDQLSPAVQAKLIRDAAEALLRVDWPVERNRPDASDESPFWGWWPTRWT